MADNREIDAFWGFSGFLAGSGRLEAGVLEGKMLEDALCQCFVTS
jgi:hypothetical protein